MTAQGAQASHFSRWLSLESPADRWTSYVAFGLGVVGLLAAVLLV